MTWFDQVVFNYIKKSNKIFLKNGIVYYVYIKGCFCGSMEISMVFTEKFPGDRRAKFNGDHDVWWGFE